MIRILICNAPDEHSVGGGTGVQSKRVVVYFIYIHVCLLPGIRYNRKVSSKVECNF